ncbi:MAG TPA: pantoate--beta-alanine ligase [Chryseolinea sp.]|nr:pantoate--beta-alanine ligase [Chryseolinea sp.]
MKIFKEIAILKTFLDEIKGAGNSIGLVPTMGALHKGHISLIEASRAQNAFTLTTIYVNPAQFNNPLDLQKYPRTLERDLKILEESGCDAVFCPSDQEMYEEQPLLKFDFGHLDKVMEGKFRPGHFSGVALVVGKLFNIVGPTIAYFGQKDWQQVTVIRRMVDELKFNLLVLSVPIVRDTDGLAMSSRNLRLTQEERVQAAVLYRALSMAKESLKSGQGLEFVRMEVKALVEGQPAMKLEYFELADSQNLTPLSNVKDGGRPIMCIAAFAGDVRLIDNMFLD